MGIGGKNYAMKTIFKSIYNKQNTIKTQSIKWNQKTNFIWEKFHSMKI